MSRATAMPSHAVHRLVGLRVCGFYSESIDRLVDKPTLTARATLRCGASPFSYVRAESGHDLSRYCCAALFELSEEILRTYGEKGLCYLILHHYLDKLSSVVRGSILRMYGDIFLTVSLETLEADVPKLMDYVREGLRLEVSSLKALELVLGGMDVDTFRALWARELRELSRNTRRRKLRLLEELYSECSMSVAGREELARRIVSLSSEVRNSILYYARSILCLLLWYDPRLAERWFGEGFGKRLREAVTRTLGCGEELARWIPR